MSTPTREVRSLFVDAVELRVGRPEGGKPTIAGHAAVFDRWTTLFEGEFFTWREVIRPGAFSNAISEGQDVRSLFNHDANIVLGRTRSGTLRLAEDAIGLMTETDTPDSQTVRDLVLVPIERGDISGMSFAFEPRRTKEVISRTGDVTVIDRGGERITIRVDGRREVEEREVLDLNLYDISPVTHPAYEQTDIALRSLAERREQSIVQGRQSRRVRLRRAEMKLQLYDAAALLHTKG